MSATIHSFPSSIQQRSYLFWKFFCAVIGDKAAAVVVREATDRTPMSPLGQVLFHREPAPVGADGGRRVRRA